MSEWVIDEEYSSTDSRMDVDEYCRDGCYSAAVGINGEVQFSGPYNDDHIEYKDLNQEINRLERLRDKAREFFGHDWPIN